MSTRGGEIVVDSLEVTVKKPGWINTNKTASPLPNVEVEKRNPNFFTKIINFFKNIFSRKNGISQTGDNPDRTPTLSPTSEPTQIIDPKTKIAITVYNSGAGEGAAGKFAAVLNAAGFTNVEATNAAKPYIKNASISYSQDDPKLINGIAQEIISLLKKNYDTVREDTKATESGKVKVMIGLNPKNVTPLPTRSVIPTQSLSPTTIIFVTPTTKLLPITPTPTKKL